MSTPGPTGYETAAPHPAAESPKSAGKSPVAKGLIVALAILVIAAVVAVAVTVIGGGTADAQVTLRPLGSSGDDPFGPSIAAAPSATLTDYAENGPRGGDGLTAAALANSRATPVTGSASLSDYRTVSGDVPGVFGGTLDERTCDVAQLVTFLESEPDKAKAWSSVLGMDASNIGAYVDTLTAANLAADTRVLEHGYSGGELVPRETVLQRGSAVLVDERGVPRVDCYSGNPLRNPMIQADETFVGPAWPGFTETMVVVVEPAATDMTEFVLVDVADGSEIVRPTGSTGEADVAPVPADTTEPAGPQPTATPAPITRELNMVGEIDVNTPISVEITSEDNEMIFEFEAAAGVILDIQVTNDRASVGAVAVDLRRDGERLEFFRVPAGGSESFVLTLDHLSGGRFEVIFTEGPGKFDFVVASESQDDAGQGRDAGADFDNALEVDSGDELAGHIEGLDKIDVYVVELQDAPALIMTTRAARETSSPAFDLQILGERIEFFRVNPADEVTYEILFGPDDDGLLELYVTEGPSDYEFVIDLVPQNDGGSGGDASAELADAVTVDGVDDIAGEVGQRDKADYYLFPAPDDEFTISIDIATDADDAVGIDLLGPDGARIDFFRIEPGASGSVTVSEPETAGETYRLIFSEGRGKYSVSLDS